MSASSFVLILAERHPAKRICGQKPVVAPLEETGDVLQKVVAEHDVFALCGGPERGLEPQVCAIAVTLGGGLLSTCHIGLYSTGNCRWEAGAVYGSGA